MLNPSGTRSFFLFGPRQTGKSTYVKSILGPNDLYINLLPQETFLNYVRTPGAFRQEILAHKKRHNEFTCIVDEIQKIPALLDEIHDLIESEGIRFILTGSSARKLKRGAANLLAGRASTYHLYPLTAEELASDFNLDKSLLVGLLPYLWEKERSQTDQQEFLRAYADIYLREEVQAEGLVRNMGPFVRFLDIAAINDGQLVNYTNIARECGVTVKTVQQYYQILEDTFLAHRLDPWVKSVRKRTVAHPKFYLFDTGITNALCGVYTSLNPEVRGRRFEQFVILQLLALNSYHRLDYQFFFWRTHTGTEVDLVLAKGDKPLIALEMKCSPHISKSDARGLKEFKHDYPEIDTYVICPVERPRLLEDGIQAMPWHVFFQEFLKK